METKSMLSSDDVICLHYNCIRTENKERELWEFIFRAPDAVVNISILNLRGDQGQSRFQIDLEVTGPGKHIKLTIRDPWWTPVQDSSGNANEEVDDDPRSGIPSDRDLHLCLDMIGEHYEELDLPVY